ncbi:MAG: hypothetical protein IJU95_03350 [Treponema sp.]|nr:hypothetical protein [Treponema sp.]
MPINTLNESELHRVLKSLYKENNEGSELEAQYGPYIVDIKTADGGVIEIQTQSLGHLADKVKYFTSKRKKIRVVFPIVKNKLIETRLLDGTVRKSRSPIHKSIYTSFRELTKLTPYLLSPYFFLDMVEVSIVEEREETEEKVQSRNGRRRFRQNWLKSGKRVKEIGKLTSFHGKKSWKALLPKSIPRDFHKGDLHKALTDDGVKLKPNDTSLMLWVYSKMELMERHKEGRGYIYKIK